MDSKTKLIAVAIILLVVSYVVYTFILSAPADNLVVSEASTGTNNLGNDQNILNKYDSAASSLTDPAMLEALAIAKSNYQLYGSK